MGSTAAFEDRVAMTRLAIAGEPAFELSLMDAPDPEGKPNYTLDSLRRLHADLGPRTALFCLMGADSFVSLHRWRGAVEIPFAATLIVASRPGLHLDDLAGLLGNSLLLEPAGPPEACLTHGVDLRSYIVRDPTGRSSLFYLLPGLDVEISASAIRTQAQAAAAGPGPALVPPAVRAYIRARGLYR